MGEAKPAVGPKTACSSEKRSGGLGRRPIGNWQVTRVSLDQDPTDELGRDPTAATQVAHGPLLVRGRRLGDGRYVLEHQLARGGMAAVWLAQDVILERPVAIKVLSDTLAGDAEFLARFKREAQVAARLSHPNLVSVYDFEAGGERPYLVMEYVAGGDLHQRLAEADEPVDVARLATELLAALRHIHGAGVLHRDVKPQNVLIAEDGRAQLTDFGIAQPRDATAITQTGHVLGTERYIAPEVLRGEPPSERSDLYALGMVLSEAAREGVGFGFWELIDALRSEDPHDRPSGAVAALADLERATPAHATPGQSTETFAPSPAPTTEEVEAVPVASADEPTPPAGAPPEGPSGPRAWLGELFSSPDRRLVLGALGALLVAVVFAVGLAISGDERDPAAGLGTRAQNDGGREEQPAGGGNEEQPPADTTETAPPEPAAGTDVTGAELNDQGFQLIQQGRYEEAIPILQRAVQELAPIGDLTYAYALFNLGNALRLAGRPEEAIPVLEQRLEIPNQTGVVQQELDAARAAAGETDSGKPPKPPKKPKPPKPEKD
jgi:eukaryotic-like serine/threonine-protein kinase